MSEQRVFVPWDHNVEPIYHSQGVWVTASEVRDVLTTSHMHCGWEVSRGGEAQPCAKTAVAIRYDEENGVLGEVCKAHAVRVLVPLAFIAQVAAAVRSTEVIRCDYCGDALPSVKSRAHIPTTPDLQRLGFDANKVVCPECVARVRSTDTTNQEGEAG